MLKMSSFAVNLSDALIYRKTLLGYTYIHDVTIVDVTRPTSDTMYYYDLSKSPLEMRHPDHIIDALSAFIPLDTTSCCLLVIVPMIDLPRIAILHDRIRAAINKEMPVSVVTDMELVYFHTDDVCLSQYTGEIEQSLDTLPDHPLHDAKARMYGFYEGDVVRLEAKEDTPSNILVVRDLSRDTTPANSGGGSSGLVYTRPWRCMQCSMPIATGMSVCCAGHRRTAKMTE